MSTMIMKEPVSWPGDGQADWQRVYELLKAAQYEQVAELLHEAHIESERMGDAPLASTLAATRQICLALAASHAEVEWHRWAYQTAHERKHALIEQLQAILGLVGKKGAVEVGQKLVILVTASATKLGLPGHEILEPVVRRRPGQRLQDLLGGKSSASSPEPEAPTVLSPQQVEGFAALSREPALELATPLVTPAEASAAAPTEAAQKGSSCVLVVYCLGPFRVYQNEQLVEKWQGHKCKSLFKYLVIHRERPIHREILMDLFWQEADPEAARKNLHQAIFNLRQTLQTGCPDFAHILLEDGCYSFNPELEVCLDSEAFTRHYQTGQRLERQDYLPQAMKEYELADSLYEGEPLAEDLYEEWTTVHRENLKHTHLDILDRLSQFYFDQEQFALCITFCHKLLAEDNCREDAHRRLMRCYFRQGQRHFALRQYHLCVEALERELAVLPMPATVELYQQIQGTRVQFPAA